jgi:hypothetical protein
VEGEHMESFALASRPMFCRIEEDFFLHAIFAGADNVPANNANDLLFIALNNMLTGTIHTILPNFVDPHDHVLLPNLHPVLSTKSATPHNLVLREPLFGLDSGMSTYGVNNIFYPSNWYDILIQDIDYNFNVTDTNAIKLDSSTVVTLVDDQKNSENITMDINVEQPTKTSFTVRSRDGIDQRLKQLTRIDTRYPLFYKYSKTSTADQVQFSLYYERGVPDYFFIFAETQFEGNVDVERTSENPRIVGINFFGRVDNNKSLCSYLLDEDELWNATRRNSHPKALMSKLRAIGGVLINRSDLGTLERHNFKKNDCFDYDILVQYDRLLHPNIPVKVHIAVIFEDKLIFQGGVDQMNFFEEKRYIKSSY